MRTRNAVLLILAFFLLIIVSVPSVYAYDPYEGACPNAEAAVCNTDKEDPISGTDGLLANIANIVAYVAGAASIILIIVAAIRFITSGGDPGNVKKARDSVIYALIGIVIVLLARTLIYFVVSFY
jgi:hypothetical protein